MRKAQKHMKVAEYYSKKGNDSKAKTYMRWAKDAADKAESYKRKTDTARDKAQSYIRKAEKALQNATKK